jgi:hypothetical protein
LASHSTPWRDNRSPQNSLQGYERYEDEADNSNEGDKIVNVTHDARYLRDKRGGVASHIGRTVVGRTASVPVSPSHEPGRLIGFWQRVADRGRDWRESELEDSIDDNPHDEETDDSGEDNDDDLSEPSLGSIGDAHFDQGRWTLGNPYDIELDNAGSGIGDLEGLLG